MKVSKFIFGASAIIMGIASAFASAGGSKKKLTTYWTQAARSCNVTTSCSPSGTTACTYYTSIQHGACTNPQAGFRLN